MSKTMRRLALGMWAMAALILITFVNPALVAAAEAPAWTTDPAKSSIAFTGRQMGVPSTGRFKTFTANVKFDPDDLSSSMVDVAVDAASADTDNPDIDKELKQPKWFDVARFPTVRFVTTAIRSKPGAGNRDYEAVAKLTIRDITEEVVLPFKLEIGADPSDAGGLLARVSGELTISRTKFGIGRDEWRDTKIVGDEVAIRIDLLARRKK